MGVCYFCGSQVDIEYRCSYCNLLFCEDHRLPEQHNCIKLPERDWDVYRSESIRMGRIKVTSPIRQGFKHSPESKRLPGKYTDTYFIRDEPNREKAQKLNPNEVKETHDNKDSFFIREETDVKPPQKPYKGSILVNTFIILLVIFTSLIVLNEFGFVDLYEWYAYIQEWYYSFLMGLMTPFMS